MIGCRTLIFSSIPTRSCAQVNNVLDLLSIFHTACIMPAQVLRSRYIDRKKLTALLNTLYKKSDFSITLKLDNWIVNIPAPLTQVSLTTQDLFAFLTASARSKSIHVVSPSDRHLLKGAIRPMRAIERNSRYCVCRLLLASSFPDTARCQRKLPSLGIFLF